MFLASVAQDKPTVKFGKISSEDLRKKVYSIDSNTAAIVIADIGSSRIIGNNRGSFSIEHKHFKRTHILKKNAYDLADVEIMLYTDGRNEEKLQNVKAHTYNLENGKIIESKLDTRNNVYSELASRNFISKKFSFPAVKEGSVIEFEYTTTSEFIFNLQPWEFQGPYPRLWSEYEVSIPDFLYYVFLKHGDIETNQQTRREQFIYSDATGAGPTIRENFTSMVNDYRMVMKNVPALKEENYISTLDNYIAKIEFQLAEVLPPLAARDIMGDWASAASELLNDENFGLQLTRDNGWMNEELSNVLAGANSDLDKAQNIYTYLQENLSCTNYNKLKADQTLKNVLRDKKGSEAEINLLLIAMLRKAGLEADPVLLSTKSHGYVYSQYPLIEKFNYVICRLLIGKKSFYLDASLPLLGFGKLYWDCYNGHARVIDKDVSSIEFSSDSITELKLTSVMLFPAEKGFAGTMQQTPGYYESYSIREQLVDEGKEEIVKQVKRNIGTEIQETSSHIDSLEKKEACVKINLEFSLGADMDKIIYLDPMFGQGFRENPFHSSKRIYPVEMPYTMDNTYILRLDIPAGYVIDELPQSTRLKFSEDGNSFFEYLINDVGGTITLRSRLKLNRSYYLPEEYELLKEFFNLVISKQREQIVLKKK